MTDVRDDAVARLLDRAAVTVEATPVDRLHEVLRRGSRRRVARFTAIGTTVAVFVAGIAWAGLSLPAENAAIPANVADWRTFGSFDQDGWTVQVPPAWRIQDFGPCWGPHLKLRRAIVTNVDFEFRNRRGAPVGCFDAYVWEGFPPDGVAFAIEPYPSRGFVISRKQPVTDFPLTRGALSETGAVRGGPTESSAVIRIPREFSPVAIVRRWVGPDASAEDVAALDRLLGSLQVRGASRWTESKGPTRTLHDEQDDFTVSYPEGWIVAAENLTPWLVSPVELLSIGTFPLEMSDDPDAGLRLFDAPVAPDALADLASDDAFVSLQESGDRFVGPERTRPEHFGPLGCADSIFGCRAENWHDVPFRAWWIPFEDAGRQFYLFVAIGNDATPERQRQAWDIADSLSFR